MQYFDKLIQMSEILCQIKQKPHQQSALRSKGLGDTVIDGYLPVASDGGHLDSSFTDNVYMLEAKKNQCLNQSLVNIILQYSSNI